VNRALRELLAYPSAVAGLGIIVLLLAMSVYAVATIPYHEAIRLWRGGEALWVDNPRNASPVWVNLLPGRDLPHTIVVRSGQVLSIEKPIGGGVRQFSMSLGFDYPYRKFPKELAVFLDPEFTDRAPNVSLFWRPPDGTEIRLTELTVRRSDVYRISSDARLQQELGGRPEAVLLGDPNAPEQPLRGRHELLIRGYLFEEGSRVEPKLIVYGEVHGLAGTDHQRRDLMIPLLWGAPIAMAFGLLAAVGSTLSSVAIAAIGVWYGRWVDGLIQRITEVNLILPTLPILIMIGTLYSRSIWVILGVVVLLGIFGSGIKTFRALFLQVKEAQASVLERFIGRSQHRHHGERVVAGQRMMQAASDIFLGWQRVRDADGQTRDYYLRQLHDWKGGVEVDDLRVPGATAYARVCGATLAIAHARWGDRIAIASYLGRGEAFDQAMVDFSVRYADQNQRDYATFVAARNSGRLTAQTGL